MTALTAHGPNGDLLRTGRQELIEEVVRLRAKVEELEQFNHRLMMVAEKLKKERG